MKEVEALSEPWTPKMVEQLIHGRTIFVDNIGKTTPQTLPMIQFDAIALTLNARTAELQAELQAELTRSRAALLEKRNYDAPLHSAERTARVEALLKQFPDSRDLAFWALGESELRDRAEQTADQRVLEVERQRALAQRGEDLAFEKWQAAEQKLAEQRWIPVSEKLPPDSTSVLTFVDKHRGIVCVNQRRLDYWDSFNASVTHWRELPAAPLVEREG
jgi:hypothetical protein